VDSFNEAALTLLLRKHTDHMALLIILEYPRVTIAVRYEELPVTCHRYCRGHT
jgi:hypothetical protein